MWVKKLQGVPLRVLNWSDKYLEQAITATHTLNHYFRYLLSQILSGSFTYK